MSKPEVLLHRSRIPDRAAVRELLSKAGILYLRTQLTPTSNTQLLINVV